jgi:hypothetical protein
VGSKGAFTLVISCPDRKNWGAFWKSPGVQLLTMPMFDEAEMHALRDLTFEGGVICDLILTTDSSENSFLCET